MWLYLSWCHSCLLTNICSHLLFCSQGTYHILWPLPFSQFKLYWKPLPDKLLVLEVPNSLKNTMMLSLDALNKYHYVSKICWRASVMIRPVVAFGDKVSLAQLNIPGRPQHPLGWDVNSRQSIAVLTQHQKQIDWQAKARLWGNYNASCFVYCSWPKPPVVGIRVCQKDTQYLHFHVFSYLKITKFSAVYFSTENKCNLRMLKLWVFFISSSIQRLC